MKEGMTPLSVCHCVFFSSPHVSHLGLDHAAKQLLLRGAEIVKVSDDDAGLAQQRDRLGPLDAQTVGISLMQNLYKISLSVSNCLSVCFSLSLSLVISPFPLSPLTHTHVGSRNLKGSRGNCLLTV